MHDLELVVQPFRRRRNPHAHRIPPLRLALGSHRRLAARLCAAKIKDKRFGRGR
jgi:hypothetical protein